MRRPVDWDGEVRIETCKGLTSKQGGVLTLLVALSCSCHVSNCSIRIFFVVFNQGEIFTRFVEPLFEMKHGSRIRSSSYWRQHYWHIKWLTLKMVSKTLLKEMKIWFKFERVQSLEIWVFHCMTKELSMVIACDKKRNSKRILFLHKAVNDLPHVSLSECLEINCMHSWHQ